MTDSELEKLNELSNRLDLINSMLLVEDGSDKKELISLLGKVGKLNLEAMNMVSELIPHSSPSTKESDKTETKLKKLDNALRIAEAMWVLLQVPQDNLDRDRLTKGTEQVMDILDEFVPRPLSPRVKKDDNNSKGE